MFKPVSDRCDGQHRRERPGVDAQSSRWQPSRAAPRRPGAWPGLCLCRARIENDGSAESWEDSGNEIWRRVEPGAGRGGAKGWTTRMARAKEKARREAREARQTRGRRQPQGSAKDAFADIKSGARPAPGGRCHPSRPGRGLGRDDGRLPREQGGGWSLARADAPGESEFDRS